MTIPPPEEQRRLDENRKRRDAQSQRMSELLLKGWKMLGARGAQEQRALPQRWCLSSEMHLLTPRVLAPAAARPQESTARRQARCL